MHQKSRRCFTSPHEHEVAKCIRVISVQWVFAIVSMTFVPACTGRGGGNVSRQDVVSSTQSLVQPGQGDVLFVVGTDRPGDVREADDILISRIRALGLSVTAKNDGAVSGADAGGRAAVVLSNSVASEVVGGVFRDVTTPVILLEERLLGVMKMTGTRRGEDFSVEDGQTEVDVRDPGQDLADGLPPGRVRVAKCAAQFVWGRPSEDAARVAALADDSTRFPIFAYETGATMVGMPAPARRVGWLAHQATARCLNDVGLRLFDAAVLWAAGLPPLETLASSAVLNEFGIRSYAFSTIDLGDAASLTVAYLDVGRQPVGGLAFTIRADGEVTEIRQNLRGRQIYDTTITGPPRRQCTNEPPVDTVILEGELFSKPISSSIVLGTSLGDPSGGFNGTIPELTPEEIQALTAIKRAVDYDLTRSLEGCPLPPVVEATTVARCVRICNFCAAVLLGSPGFVFDDVLVCGSCTACVLLEAARARRRARGGG
jgi:hypothetical protein